MLPTNKFRWLIKRNTVTADQVKAYREANHVTLNEAKTLLVNQKPPVLQQLWYGHDFQQWVDVPTEYEPSPLTDGDTE